MDRNKYQEKINSDINARISGKVSFVPIDSTNCVCRKKLEKRVTGEYTINRKLRKLRHGMNNRLQAC